MTADPTPEALRLAALDEIVCAWERATPSTPQVTREAMVALADVLHGKAPTTVAIRERYCLDAARATIEEVRRIVGAEATEATTEAVERLRDALTEAQEDAERAHRVMIESE